MKPVSGRIEVLTFKDGLLSKVAHDLMVELRQFHLEPDGARIKGGVLDAHGISESDRLDINANVQKRILRTGDFPDAKFAGEATRGAGGYSVVGKLTLVGKTQDITATARETDGHWRGEAELVPTRWGIQPYKALFGAIRLQDRVIVRFDFPVVQI